MPPEVPLDGRYTVVDEIGCGGMATVYYALLQGPGGFSRPVAIKRLHPHLCRDPDFVAMFEDETRLSACLRHVNIVPTLDVVRTPEHVALVMEYVHGVTLAQLLEQHVTAGHAIPAKVAVSVMVAVLRGLQSAHEAVGPSGEALQMVHRDVSPENILFGADGVPRILDFGIAKANGRLRETTGEELKGKLRYIAPEQLRSQDASVRTDVYGAGVVLWESLAGQTRFDGASEAALIRQVLEGDTAPPSHSNPGVSRDLDAVTMRAVAREPGARFGSARQMAQTLEVIVPVLSSDAMARWLQKVAGRDLDARAERLRQRVANLTFDGPAADTGTTRPIRAHNPGPAGGPAGAVAQATTSEVAPDPGGAVVPRGKSRRQPLLLLGAVGLLAAGAAYAGTGAFEGRDRQPGSADQASWVAPATTASAAPPQAAAAPPQAAATPPQAAATPPQAAATPLANRLQAPPTVQVTAPKAPIAVAVPTATATKAKPGPTKAKPGPTKAKPGPTKSKAGPRPTRAASGKGQQAKKTPAGLRSDRRTLRAKAPCDPPFTIDERGVKRFRIECLAER